MRQAETTDAEEDEAFGADNNDYSLPDGLQRREERLQRIRSLREELEREKRAEQHLKEDQAPVITDREQRSFADSDARMMLMKRGEFDYGYNAQACTDEGHGVIVAAALTNEAADTGHLPDMVQEVRQLRDDLGVTEAEKKTVITADDGYFSVDNIRQEGQGVELLISSGREGKEPSSADKGVYSVERFDYIRESDRWKCPDGRLLVRGEKTSPNGRPLLRRYVCQDCGGCPSIGHCLKPGEDGRSLLVKRKQLTKAGMRARLKKPEKQAIYRKRKWVAEQVFGQIKDGLGFRGTTVRGEEQARAQWLFVCAVHNVLKAVRYICGNRRDADRPGDLALAGGRKAGNPPLQGPRSSLFSDPNTIGELLQPVRRIVVTQAPRVHGLDRLYTFDIHPRARGVLQ
jgi:transposase